MRPDPSVIFALYILIIICFIWFSYQVINPKNYEKHIYELWEVQDLPRLTEDLLTRHQELSRIAHEYVETKDKSKKKLDIIDFVYTDVYLKSTKDQWYPNWFSGKKKPANPKQWIYPIIHDGRFHDHVKNQTLKDIFTPYLSRIRNLGFVWLQPHGSIHTHTEPEGAADGVLEYNYNLYGEGSIIVIDGKYQHQVPRETLLFDPTVPHSVKNGFNDRVIITARLNYG